MTRILVATFLATCAVIAAWGFLPEVTTPAQRARLRARLIEAGSWFAATGILALVTTWVVTR